MQLNSSSAFALATAGRMTEEMARDYDRHIEGRLSQYSHAKGWLGEAITRAKEMHRHYIDSGMWDYANIVRGSSGVYVGKYDIGYLSTLQSQRNAIGLMQFVISANPTVRSLIKEERIAGYQDVLQQPEWEKDLDYYFDKLNDGLAVKRDEQFISRHYSTSRDNYTHYSSRERTDAQRTWRMTNRFIDKGFDPTSMSSILTTEEVEEKRKKVAEERASE